MLLDEENQRKGHTQRYREIILPSSSREHIEKISSYAFEGGTERGHLRKLMLQAVEPESIHGKVILDYGGGMGDLSLYLGFHGALRVFTIDISDEAVTITKERARVSGLSHVIEPILGSVNRLPFKEHMFDYIFGEAILHHVYHLPEAANELSRVLKSRGKAIFQESLSDSLFMKLPRLVTKWNFDRRFRDQGEHFMYRKIIYDFGKNFNSTTIKGYSIFYMAKRFLRMHYNHHGYYKTWAVQLLRQLYLIDQKLLRLSPWTSNFCGEAIVIYSKERPDQVGEMV